jgi:hypothetical protein
LKIRQVNSFLILKCFKVYRAGEQTRDLLLFSLILRVG